MQLALFHREPSARGRSKERTSARRRCPAQHEVRPSETISSSPELSFLRALEGESGPAAPRPKPRSQPAQLTVIAGAAAEDATRHRPAHPARGKTLAPEVFQDREVRALLSACSQRAVTGVRNKALLALLWRTGLRISEALDLLPCDVNFEQGTVRVRLGKGLKSRTTVVNDTDCLPLLQDWLERRRSLDEISERAPLFCTLHGRRVETSYIRHLMPRLARRAGITQRVHVHALRHTHAADLAIAGVPVPAIQQQLGHASLATTSDYLKRVGVRLDMHRWVRRRTAEPPRTAPTPAAPNTYW